LRKPFYCFCHGTAMAVGMDASEEVAGNPSAVRIEIVI
jgi:hypothetical protein